MWEWVLCLKTPEISIINYGDILTTLSIIQEAFKKIYFLIIYFSGTDTRMIAPRIKGGPAKDGENYYEVTTSSRDNKIEGCYAKIAFHSVHSQAAGHKYPMYKQTGGQIYLRIDEEKDKKAPWVFADEQEIVLYE